MKIFKLSPNEIKTLTDLKGGCLASDKITVNGQKVGYAYREKPDSNFLNDSGWRFLAGDENEEYLNNPDNFNTFEINTICNYDKDILSILDGKIGEVYVRDGDTFKLNFRPQFPDDATDEEKSIDWKLIAKITDKDLGFDFPDKSTDKCRFNTRLILKRDDGKICFVKSIKYGYQQIPGGGIDNNENIEQGLRREAREETGFEIKNLKPLGVTVEYRGGSKYEWFRAFSFCYAAESEKEVGTSYMQDEIDEGFEPIWLDLDEAIKIFEKAGMELRDASDRNYSGSFSSQRDLSILKYYARYKK